MPRRALGEVAERQPADGDADEALDLDAVGGEQAAYVAVSALVEDEIL